MNSREFECCSQRNPIKINLPPQPVTGWGGMRESSSTMELIQESCSFFPHTAPQLQWLQYCRMGAGRREGRGSKLGFAQPALEWRQMDWSWANPSLKLPSPLPPSHPIDSTTTSRSEWKMLLLPLSLNHKVVLPVHEWQQGLLICLAYEIIILP